MLLLSVGYLDHGEPENLIAQLVALLEHLHHGVLTDVLVLHVHHGIVLLRIEGLALRLNAGDAQLLQHCQKLPADQLHALTVGVALVKLGKATLQVIQHPQNSLTVSALASA